MTCRFPIRRSPCVSAAVLGLAFALPAAAQEYSLDVPGNPAQRSQAVIEGNTLTIIDSAGKSHVYIRTQKFDTPDGAFIGWFNKGADQSLRWPAAGRGKFLIGDPAGLAFRESRMTITPRVGGAPAIPRPVVPLPNPGVGRPVAPPGVGQPAGPPLNPFELAFLPVGRDELLGGYIDARGRLQLYQGWNDTWRKRTLAGRFDGLIPGAPLAMQLDRDGTPILYTVTNRGELVEYAAGQAARPLTQDAAFPPGAHVALKSGRRSTSIVAVDDRGRIWGVNLRTNEARSVEARPGRYEPGSPVVIVEGADDQLFLIDRQGSLVSYVSVRGQWEGPEALFGGCQPGGHVAAVAQADPIGLSLTVGLADARGQLRVHRHTAGAWSAVPVARTLLAPGAPVAIAYANDGLHASAVTNDGVWIDWAVGPRGALTPREIGRGFPPAAPAQLFARENQIQGMCVDSAGRLVAASNFDDEWHIVLCLPEFDLAPRLISRRIVANDPLPPVQVQLDNNHTEELVVRLIDEQAPAAPAELRIAPGQAARQSLQRDAGAVLEERWMIPTPAGQWVEDVRRTEIPPQVKYRLVVYANRTTYQYVDKRKKPGPVANFDMKSNVSLGSFRLPPGPAMNDGDAFDVYKDAVRNRNPGAAALFDPQGAP